jgi:hypothetical protein
MRRRFLIVAGLCIVCAISPDRAQAQAAPIWPDTFLTPVEALALVETLNASLLAARSTTFALDRWCADHKLAKDAKIHAQVVRGAEKPITAEQRRRLEIDDREPEKFRHVELKCGDHTLSEADNWYVPPALPPR